MPPRKKVEESARIRPHNQLYIVFFLTLILIPIDLTLRGEISSHGKGCPITHFSIDYYPHHPWGLKFRNLFSFVTHSNLFPATHDFCYDCENAWFNDMNFCSNNVSSS